MKNVLLIDFETTGVDPAKDRIIEVGLVLFSLEHATPAACSSFFVDAGVGNAAVGTNAIPPAALISHGYPEQAAFDRIARWARDADAFVGHNAYTFDRLFVPEQIRTLKPWIDTCHDVTWPGVRQVAKPEEKSPIDEGRSRPGRSLVALCLEHGIGVTHAHRALTDCLLIARLLERCAEMGHDLNALLAPGLRPKAKFASLAPFDMKDVVKAHGFAWEPEPKLWTRTMAVEDAEKLPFRVMEMP